jgi:hypothetical protein
MTERDRIILTMTDIELLMFHKLGGNVPAEMKCRVARLIDEHQHERKRVFPRRLEPERTPVVYVGVKPPIGRGMLFRPKFTLEQHRERRERKNAMTRKRYAEDRERILAVNREWRKNNREKFKEICRRYEKAHRVELNAAARERRAKARKAA